MISKKNKISALIVTIILVSVGVGFGVWLNSDQETSTNSAQQTTGQLDMNADTESSKDSNNQSSSSDASNGPSFRGTATFTPTNPPTIKASDLVGNSDLTTNPPLVGATTSAPTNPPTIKTSDLVGNSDLTTNPPSVGAITSAPTNPPTQKHTGMNGNSNGGSMSSIIHNLLDNRPIISRDISKLEGGIIQTRTVSNDPQVASWIQQHVKDMIARVEAGLPVRRWDPLFVEAFSHSHEMIVDCMPVDNGMVVNMTGLTPCGKAIADTHSRVVSLFLSLGREEVRKEHPAPEECL